MAAQTFETQAIIRLMDEVSGPLKGLAAAVKTFNQQSGIASSQASKAATQATRDAENAARRSAQAIKDAFSGVGHAISHYARHASREMLNMTLQQDRTLTKLKMFGHLDNETMQKVRKYSNIEGSHFTGGPEETAGAFLALQRGGFNVQKNFEGAKAMMPFIQGFALEQDLNREKATELFIDHLNMSGHATRNKNSHERVKLDELSPERLAEVSRETVGGLAIIAQKSNQTVQQVYLMMKAAGPIAHATGMNWAQLATLGAALGPNGIKGEELGNTIKSGISRVMAPTSKARAGIAALGVDVDRFYTFNTDLVDPKNVITAMRKRAGNLGGGVEGRISGLTQDWHDKKIGAQQYQDQVADILVKTGAKTFKDRIAATNFARDLTQPFAQSVDFLGMLKALKGAPGALNMVFARQQGGRFAALRPDEVEKIDKLLKDVESESKDKMGQATVDDRESSFSGKWDRMTGAFQGMLLEIFEPWKKTFMQIEPYMTSFFQSISGASEGMRRFVSGTAMATAAFASLRVAIMPLLAIGSLLTGAAGVNSTAGKIGVLSRVAGFLAKMTIPVMVMSMASSVIAAMAGAYNDPNSEIGGMLRLIGDALNVNLNGKGKNAEGKSPMEVFDETNRKNAEQTTKTMHSWGLNVDQNRVEMMGFAVVYAKELFQNALHELFPELKPPPQPQPEMPSGINREGKGNRYHPITPVDTPLEAVLQSIHKISDIERPPTQVQGDISGSAQVEVAHQLTLNPSEYFQSIVATVKQAAVIGMNGKLGTGMSGSNGVTPGRYVSGAMPLAAARGPR